MVEFAGKAASLKWQIDQLGEYYQKQFKVLDDLLTKARHAQWFAKKEDDLFHKTLDTFGEEREKADNTLQRFQADTRSIIGGLCDASDAVSKLFNPKVTWDIFFGIEPDPWQIEMMQHIRVWGACWRELPESEKVGTGTDWIREMVKDPGRTNEKVHYTISNTLKYNWEHGWSAKNLTAMKEAVVKVISIMRDYRPQENKFKWAGFQVVLSTTGLQSPLSKEKVEKIKASIDAVVTRLKAFHVKPSYYAGVLQFHKHDRQLEKEGAAGQHNSATDLVSVNVIDKEIRELAYILAHELAHRVWFKLPANARYAWNAFINALAKPVPQDVRHALEVVVNVRGNRYQEEQEWRRVVAAFPVYAHLGSSFATAHHIPANNYPGIATTILKKGRTEGLPSIYAETTPTEAFPEMFVCALGFKGWDSQAAAPLISAIMHDIISGLHEEAEGDDLLLDISENDLAGLTEMSFGPGDVPPNFRVAIELYNYEGPIKATGEQLARMELKGVKGISDKANISIHWFGMSREAMLVMNGEETIRLNKISRIMYDNPHYLMQNNMYALKRLYNDKSADNYQTIFNLFEYFFAAMRKMGKQEYAAFTYNLGTHSAGYQELARAWSKMAAHPKIDTIYDMAKWLKGVGAPSLAQEFAKSDFNKYIGKIWGEFSQLPVNDLAVILERGLKLVGTIYKSEGEWVMKGDVLKIPGGSRLFVMRPKIPEDTPQNRKMYMHNYAFKGYDHATSAVKDYGLDKAYRVIFVNPARWEEIKKQYFTKHAHDQNEAFELKPSEDMPTDPEFHPELLRDMVDEFNRTFGANSAGVHPIDFISKQMNILGHYSIGPARAHIGKGKSFGTSVFTGLHEMGHHYFNTVVVKSLTVPAELKKEANALEELFCDEVAVRLGADLIDTWKGKGKAPKDAVDSFKKEVRTEVWNRNVLQTIHTQAGENADMVKMTAASNLLGKDSAFQTSVIYSVFAGNPASAESASTSIGAQWKVLGLKGDR